MDEPSTVPADRITRLLKGLRLAYGVGLEFGPLAHPILRRVPGRSFAADHLPTASLRGKYRDDRAVDIEAIAAIDVVWAEGLLPRRDRRRAPGRRPATLRSSPRT